MKNYSRQTKTVHAGKRPDSLGVVNSVEPSSAFRYLDEGVQYYPRYFNTPNQQNVIKQICSLENAEAGLIFGSGMAAITTTLIALLKRGDHIVLQKSIYGGTHSMVVKEFDNAGIEYSFADSDVDAMIAAVKSNTRVLFAETPANPLLEIVDLKSLAQQANARNVVTVVDNTFASPINQNPIDLGIDVIVHSGTKYLGGHSDLSFGAVVGSQSNVDLVHAKAIHYGGNVNAMTCYLIERSIKTLAVRVKQQNENAMSIAEFLSSHPKVESVFYPGLESHRNHAIAKIQMPGGFGGMLSFTLVSGLAPKAFLKSLELIEPAMSLGAVETTVTVPAITSHRAMPADVRAEMGITDQLIRVSTGIECVDDLIGDLKNAFANQSGSPSMEPDSVVSA